MHPHETMKYREGVLPVTTPTEIISLLKSSCTALQSSKRKASVCGGMAEKVTIVKRQEWGAAAPKQKEALKGTAQRVFIHHTANPSCKDQKACMDRLVSIQRVHMTERGFDDIGYNFLVGPDGTVYEGRGWAVVGAHAKKNNHDSLGIAFMGNFDNDTPSAEAMSSVKKLLKLGVCEGNLTPKFTLLGHRDVGDTKCPGDKLYAALPQLRDA
ncbi:peptidoglycan recognition protein 5 [Epinephelus fuscoguttatus]|uniref:peptidoglycan recognition protein 5 n=1 Tax=Epinephelus fuscoguttatus TaxID=293821 RepID=UPI0020D05385|nr:peptidoglycan recognition protein 5 [Epinephelus fuscoguttatus]